MLKNTKFYRGDTMYFKLEDTKSYDCDNLDLTNKKIVVSFKRNQRDTDDNALLKIEFTTDSTLELKNGNLDFTIGHDDSKTLRVGNVFYDIRVVDEATDPITVVTVINDKIRVYEEISDLDVEEVAP